MSAVRPAPIQELAFLVTMKIRQWDARKHDKTVSNEVDKAHNAKGGGRYNKLLVAKEALDPISQIEGAARQYLYKMTHAWGDNGERLLPGALSLDFGQNITVFRNEFNSRVRVFVDQYPALKQEARVRLGSMYDPQDYPADIRSKFAFPPLGYNAIADADDFRVKLNADYMEDIKSRIRERTEELQSDALKQCWERVRKVVTKITELGAKDTKVFDSVMDNARELVDLLPALNLNGNPELIVISDEIRAILVPPDRLRQDKRLKADTAAKADAILAKLPWA